MRLLLNVREEEITYQVCSFQTLNNRHHKSAGLLLDRRVQKQPTLKLLKGGGFYQIRAKIISHPGFRETGQSLVVDSSRNAQDAHTNKERWIVSPFPKGVLSRMSSVVHLSRHLHVVVGMVFQ